MCPDPQLLSVYYDRELTSPWKEKMERHLTRCPQCRRRLENYSLLSPAAGDKSASLAAAAAAEVQVWKKLEEKTGLNTPNSEYTPIQSGSPYHSGGTGYSGVFWSRRISIPLPLAAAAALVILMFAALLTIRTREQRTMPNMTLASEEYSLWSSGIDTGFDPASAAAGMVPFTDLNGVLQYLGSRDSGDIVILHLPEKRNFFSSGEPAIIKAADYSRRKP